MRDSSFDDDIRLAMLGLEDSEDTNRTTPDMGSRGADLKRGANIMTLVSIDVEDVDNFRLSEAVRKVN